MIIFSYKAVGTFDRISVVLFIFDVVLLFGLPSGMRFFSLLVNLTLVFGLTDTDRSTDLDFVGCEIGRIESFDCFDVDG